MWSSPSVAWPPRKSLARRQSPEKNRSEESWKGRLNAFYKENVLLEQSYVKDPSKTVGDLFKEVGGAALAFARVEVGKGEAE